MNTEDQAAPEAEVDEQAPEVKESEGVDMRLEHLSEGFAEALEDAQDLLDEKPGDKALRGAVQCAQGGIEWCRRAIRERDQAEGA